MSSKTHHQVPISNHQKQSMAGVQAIDGMRYLYTNIPSMACSEIIPFKLDLDNSSAKDYCCFMMIHFYPPLCWVAD